MSEKILKREEMRRTAIELKKLEKESNKIGCESSDAIMKEINDLKVDIEANLTLLSSGENKSKLETDLQNIIDKYDRLKQYINESTLYLAKYNVKSVQLILSSLRSKIEDKKESLIPKSKFCFKKSIAANREIHVSVKPNTDTNDVTDSSIDKGFNYDFNQFIGFKNITDSQVLKILSQDSNAKDIQLENIENCVIEIYGSPNTLKINKLLNCKVFCGPITTSIFIANCKTCSLNIACQQLRVHTSSDCDIYLHVTSRAIIEESTTLRFAPYSWSYLNIENDFKNADLDQTINNWKQIDDFDWLSTDKPSPNWTFLT